MSTTRFYTDLGRMIEQSDRDINPSEEPYVEDVISGLRGLLHGGVVAIPTASGHTIIPIDRLHAIDIINDDPRETT